MVLTDGGLVSYGGNSEFESYLGKRLEDSFGIFSQMRCSVGGLPTRSREDVHVEREVLDGIRRVLVRN